MHHFQTFQSNQDAICGLVRRLIIRIPRRLGMTAVTYGESGEA